MEVLFVYGLVVVFFVLLIPLIYLLMKDPIQNIEPEPESMPSPTKSSSARIAYGILAALFTFMCVLTVLVHRTKS